MTMLHDCMWLTAACDLQPSMSIPVCPTDSDSLSRTPQPLCVHGECHPQESLVDTHASHPVYHVCLSLAGY